MNPVTANWPNRSAYWFDSAVAVLITPAVAAMNEIPVTTMAIGWPGPLTRQIVNQLSVKEDSQLIEKESQCRRVP